MFIRVSGGRKKSEKFVATEGTISVTTNVTGASITVTTGSEIAAKATAAASETAITTDKIKNGTYTVTISKIGYAAVTKTVVVNGDVKLDVTLEKADGIKVNSVSAVNATTVELKLASPITADYKATFNFDGKDIAADKVEYKDSTVLLTVPEMVDNQSYVVIVKDNEGKEVYNGKVTYDKNEITKIEILTSDLNQTIGNNVSVSVKLTNEDGVAIPNKDLTLESSGNYSSFEKPITLTATTNAEGVATFTWARSHETDSKVSGGTDVFDIYSNDKPTVRVQSAITWTLSDKLVSIDNEGLKSEQLSDGSAFEFTVNAKNADGSKFKGNLNLEFDEENKDAKASPGTYTIQVWDGKKWVNSQVSGSNADGELIHANSAVKAIYEVTEDDKGSKKFRIFTTNDNVKKIAVTAWYDADNDGVLKATDPRAVTGSKEYVAAKPVIKLTAKNTSNVIATEAIKDETSDQKLYTLSVVDQFGKPFRGTVVLDDYAKIDQNVTTQPKGSNFTIAISDKQDGKYTDYTSVNSGNGIDFAIGKSDSDENSTVDVKLTNTTAKEEIVLTALIDIKDADSKDDAKLIDANDVYVKADKVESQERAIATLTVTPVDTKAPAAGGNYMWKVTAKDQFGSDFTTSSTKFSLQLKDNKGNAITEGDVKVNVNLTGDAVDKDGKVNGSASWETAGYNLENKSVTKFPTYIRIEAGKADKEYQVQTWINDVNGSSTAYEAGEITTTAKVAYEKAVVSKGEISAIAADSNGTGSDSTPVVAADKLAAYVKDFDAETTYKDAVKLTYALKDQSGQAFNLSGSGDTAVKTTWTLTNNGNDDITVNDGQKEYTLAKGATGTYNVNSSLAAESVAELIIKSTKETQVDVSVVAEGVEKASTTKIFYTAAVKDENSEGSYSGTVVAVDKDAQWAIIKTAIGNIVVKYGSVTKFVIDGNTATSTLIKDHISVGDTLKLEKGTGDAVVTLTNK